jgi:membrane fusion protein (multidrug efflux system)
MNVMAPSPQASTPTRPAGQVLRGRLIRLGVLVLVLGGAGLGVSWWWSVGRFMEQTENAYVQGDVASLAFRVDGNVAAIRVADNQRVARGDVLVELDPALYQARVAQAEASLADAAGAIATLGEQLALQSAQVGVSQALLTQAGAEQARASSDARRYQGLAAQGWSSRQTEERARADGLKAAAAIGSAEAQLAAARQQMVVLQAQARQAEARRDQASAALRLAQLDLAQTVLRAPFDGIVGNRAAQLGQYVRPGQNLIAVAPPPERQWVVANFKETQLARFRPGMPVRVKVDALDGLELHGRIDSLAPATGSLFSLLPPENATGNFTKIVQRVPVRVTLDAADAAKLALLRPGLSVVAEADTRDDPTASRSTLGALGSTLARVFGSAALAAPQPVSQAAPQPVSQAAPRP